jgi:phosphatidylinositol alpha 1,6-mannosyltransferase
MFPKIASLPLGIPKPRMVRLMRKFDPHVVHRVRASLVGGQS